MNKEFKKTFFVCLLAVLLVISNIICAKYTNFLDVTIGVEFVTFPFTFLCTLLILNIGSKRDAYRGILVAGIIQLLITISYTFIVNLGSQSLMPDKGIYVDALFKVEEINILAAVLAFVLSHCTLIYLYTSFKQLGKELYGLVIGLLGAMTLNSIVYLFITLNGYEPIFIINLLLSNIIVSVIMVVVLTMLFYILRDKNEIVVPIKNIEEQDNKDISVEELVTTKKIVSKPKTTSKTKKTKPVEKKAEKTNVVNKTTTSKRTTKEKTKPVEKKVKKTNTVSKTTTSQKTKKEKTKKSS